MKSVALHNLGCKVNAYEIDVMQQMLQESGYSIVAFDEKADIYIVNTCSVTNIADRKSRQMLHKAKKQNPEAVVVAVGCYVQSGKEKIEKDECIDLAIGNNKKKELVSIIEEFLATNQKDKTLNNTTVIDMSQTKDYEDLTLKKTAGHTRAYIKIQDGCNQFCSYCIIPHTRGRVRSRLIESIKQEIDTLTQKGYDEFVLTGIHISSYGRDWDNGVTLLTLIQALHQIPSVKGIRLGSLEPGIITEELVQALAAMPKVCPHFHLSLQSGCDATLARMNRKYNTMEFSQKVALLRKYYGKPGITTDVIVGFPGETEEDFQITTEFLRKIHFSEMHIFKYSKREGTSAAVMEHQVDDKIKADRSNILLELEKVQAREYRTSFLEEDVEILLEDKKIIDQKEYFIGYTGEYIKAALPAMEQYISGQRIKGNVKRFLTEDMLLLQSCFY